jgi:hypothetical protein
MSLIAVLSVVACGIFVEQRRALRLTHARQRIAAAEAVTRTEAITLQKYESERMRLNAEAQQLQSFQDERWKKAIFGNCLYEQFGFKQGAKRLSQENKRLAEKIKILESLQSPRAPETRRRPMPGHEDFAPATQAYHNVRDAARRASVTLPYFRRRLEIA